MSEISSHQKATNNPLTLSEAFKEYKYESFEKTAMSLQRFMGGMFSNYKNFAC